jgi:hypothetical protein
MRAQIALIFVIFVVGIIVQSKACNTIKERRQKQRAALLEIDRQRDQVEEDLGRRLEEGNNRERVHWEAAYRERHHEMGIAANVGNLTERPRKTSLGIVGTRESGPPTESFELVPLSFSRDEDRDTIYEIVPASTPKTIAHHRITDEDQHVHSLRPGIASPVGTTPTQDSSNLPLILSLGIPKRKPIPNTPRRETTANEITRSRPTILPPPPHDISSEVHHDETRVEFQIKPVAEHALQLARSLNKLSLKPTSKKPSAASWRAALESEEALPIPEVDLSRSSSLAVTVDINNDTSDPPALDGEAEINDYAEQPQIFGDSVGSTNSPKPRRGGIPKRLRSDSKDTTTLKEWLGCSKSRIFSDEAIRDPMAATRYRGYLVKLPRLPLHINPTNWPSVYQSRRKFILTA